MSLASAEILINQQPKDSYNIGEMLNFPIKITTSGAINKFLQIYLICNGQETEVHKQYIYLKSGEEIQVSPTIHLIPLFTHQTSGTCKIKAILGEEYVLSKEFTISDLITITIDRKSVV